MKKNLLLGILLLPSLIFAQFENYFRDTTVRIDYLHFGNRQKDAYKIKYFNDIGEWAKSKVNLIDTFEYGNQKVEVLDEESGKLLYSFSYNTLFGEYRTTEEGKNNIKTFKECVSIPLPKKSVILKFYTMKQGKDYEEKYTYVFNPSKVKIKKSKNDYKVVELHRASDKNAYDLIIVPEGYAPVDSLKMILDLKRCCKAIIEAEPFKSNASRINIRAILCYSEESGISCENTKNETKKTIVGASFYSLNLERYLMVDDVWRLHKICANVPYENIMILCNTKKYGGGGIYNWYASVSDNVHFNYVCIHELGHCIAGLADEYYNSEVTVQDMYLEGVEPVEPNITNLVHFEKKWMDMLQISTPVPTPAIKANENRLGVYEGAAYCAKGLYRPWMNCTMKDVIYDNFCPVCRRAFQRMFDFCCK